MIVTIGGSAASGKSTLAAKLSEKLCFKRLSAGEIMRHMAAERDMSLLEFSSYAEKHPEIDKEIDERQKKIVKTGDYVVDGRLSAYFLKPDVSIWLHAPLEVRAKRLFERGEKYSSLKAASDAINEREASERKRYKKCYKIDLGDLGVYDLVLNTGKFDIPQMTEISFNAVNLRRGV